MDHYHYYFRRILFEFFNKKYMYLWLIKTKKTIHEQFVLRHAMFIMPLSDFICICSNLLQPLSNQKCVLSVCIPEFIFVRERIKLANTRNCKTVKRYPSFDKGTGCFRWHCQSWCLQENFRTRQFHKGGHKSKKWL